MVTAIFTPAWQNSVESNISLHAEAGHFVAPVGTGVSLLDNDHEVAAAQHLAQGLNAQGRPLVNEAGELQDEIGDKRSHPGSDE